MMSSDNKNKHKSPSTSRRSDTPRDPPLHDRYKAKEFFLHTDTEFDPNDAWDDSIEQKCSHSIRLYFENVHGLKPSANWNKWCDMLSALRTHQVDIIGFAETNVNWNPILARRAQAVVRKQFGSGVMINTTSDDPVKSAYKQGGTSQILLGNTIGAIQSNHTDERGLGRWVYTIINGKNNKKLVIVTAYRVCKDSMLKGHSTVYAQQYRILRRQNVTNPHPKQQFDKDLISLLQQWRKQQFEIILMIDANDTILASRFQKILHSGELYDLLSSKHGANAPNTYLRGTNTIDYILGTKGVKYALERCGMLSFNDGILSDHRALWIDLNLNNLDQKLPNIYTRPPHHAGKEQKMGCKS